MSNHSLRYFGIAAGLTILATQVLSAADLVDIKKVDATIEVELRYAGPKNVLGRPLYPASMPALIRPDVARRLVDAQSYLQVRGYRLKIWDAYRPKPAQDQLWTMSQNRNYVANPVGRMGSLHTWGVAVDATLVYDDNGKEVMMPTDFDDFTPAAMLRYLGPGHDIRNNLHVLQRAMGKAGFLGMRTEWWHFIAKDWQRYSAIPDTTNTAQNFAPAPRVPSDFSGTNGSSMPAR